MLVWHLKFWSTGTKKSSWTPYLSAQRLFNLGVVVKNMSKCSMLFCFTENMDYVTASALHISIQLKKYIKNKSRFQWRNNNWCSKALTEGGSPWTLPNLPNIVSTFPHIWLWVIVQPTGHVLWASPRWWPCKSASFSEGMYNCCQSFCFFHCTVINSAGAQSQSQHWR